MARKSSSTAYQEELYPGPDSEAFEPRRPVAASLDDARLVDLEADQESPFLRGQKRVAVRRGSIPKKTAIRLKWVALAVFILAILGAAASALYSYGKHSWRFRIDSSDQIEIFGAEHVSHAQIMEVMGGDIGRNIFFVPLAQRQEQLSQIAWVESASVMRFVPNRLCIEIHERTPVAFARVGSHISLIDAGGNLMELSPAPRHKFSFPVITGMNAAEPLSTRAARMKSYNDLMRQLDSGGARYSQEISEVDLSDGEDVKILTADPAGGVLVHLGNGNYLQRYKVYVARVQAWRQQFSSLDSVDLRYEGQIIVNPDLQGMARQPVLTPAAARAALAAGVKNAALVNYEKYVQHPAAPAHARQSTAPGKASLKPSGKAAPKASARRAAPKAKPKTVARNVAPASKPQAEMGKSPAASQPAVAQKSPVTKSPLSQSAPLQTAPAPSSSRPQTVTASATAKSSPAAPPPSDTAGAHKKPSAAIPREAPQN